jgi:hypothetical protein
MRRCGTIENIAGNAGEDCTQAYLNRKDCALSATENLLQKRG